MGQRRQEHESDLQLRIGRDGPSVVSDEYHAAVARCRSRCPRTASWTAAQARRGGNVIFTNNRVVRHARRVAVEAENTEGVGGDAESEEGVGRLECGPTSTSVRRRTTREEEEWGGMAGAQKMIRDPISPRSISSFYHSAASSRPRPSALRLIVGSHESSNVGRLTGPSPTESDTPKQPNRPSPPSPSSRGPSVLSTLEFLIVLAIRAEP